MKSSVTAAKIEQLFIEAEYFTQKLDQGLEKYTEISRAPSVQGRIKIQNLYLISNP